jgi:two-component system sensor histidine kinase KdpD
MPVALALVTALGRGLGAKSTTAGFLYLAVVLGLALWGGCAVGAVASVTAALGLNYFFLPPFGTLVIHDASNWVALVSFLAASTLVSRLVATARGQAEEAQKLRRELETLYDLSFGLFAASRHPGALGEAAARTLAAIGADSGVLVLVDGGGSEVASAVGEERLSVDDAALARAGETRQIVEAEGGAVYLPLHVGGHLDGVLVSQGPLAPRAILEPAGRLLALAIERERLMAEAAHAEGLRESDRLKTSLLRAVSHDLRTPLTSMRLEIESLGRHLAGEPRGRGEGCRLNRSAWSAASRTSSPSRAWRRRWPGRILRRRSPPPCSVPPGRASRSSSPAARSKPASRRAAPTSGSIPRSPWRRW